MASKGELTRQRILDRAARVFQRKGLGATSVNDLLEESGVTKGNLYFHFPGKEAVAVAVLRREREAFLAFLDEALAGEHPAASLDIFLRRALHKHRQTGFVGGCLFGNTALESSDCYPVYAELVAELFDAWVARLRETIASAQALGMVRRDLPAEQLARLTVATIEGGIMQSRLTKSDAPLAGCLESLRILLELQASPATGNPNP